MKKWILILILLLAALTCACATRYSKFEKRFGAPASNSAPPEGGGLAGAKCEDDSLYELALSRLEQALAPYGEGGLQQMGVSAVVICDNLTRYGERTPAALGGDNRVYVDASLSDGSADYARALHKAVFQAFEAHKPIDTQKWVLCNPFEQSPYQSGHSLSSGGAALPFEPSYISHAARVSPEEDAAELFSLSLAPYDWTPSERAQLSGDRYLRDKARFLSGHLEGTNIAAAFAAGSDALFAYFPCAKGVYAVTSTRAVRTGGGENYPPAGVSVGDVLCYTGAHRDTAEDGQWLCLADEAGMRVYAPEKKLKRLDTLDFASDKRLRESGVYVNLEPEVPAGISYASLPMTASGRIDYFNAGGGGGLAAAALAIAEREFSRYAIAEAVKFCPVKQLARDFAKVDYCIFGRSLLVDVERCTGKALASIIEEFMASTGA